MDSAPEPGPSRYALANAGDCFVDGTLCEQCRATQQTHPDIEVDVKMHYQTYPLGNLCKSHLANDRFMLHRRTA